LCVHATNAQQLLLVLFVYAAYAAAAATPGAAGGKKCYMSQLQVGSYLFVPVSVELQWWWPLSQARACSAVACCTADVVCSLACSQSYGNKVNCIRCQRSGCCWLVRIQRTLVCVTHTSTVAYGSCQLCLLQCPQVNGFQTLYDLS
jgi:hypothetical protein